MDYEAILISILLAVFAVAVVVTRMVWKAALTQIGLILFASFAFFHMGSDIIGLLNLVISSLCLLAVYVFSLNYLPIGDHRWYEKRSPWPILVAVISASIILGTVFVVIDTNKESFFGEHAGKLPEVTFLSTLVDDYPVAIFSTLFVICLSIFGIVVKEKRS